MSWFTHSFSSTSPAWLVVSGVLGGVTGAAVTFVFQDVLAPWLSFRRESDRLIRKFTVPLLRSADRLESRINILIRNADQDWQAGDDYFRMSTLFIFADFLGWVVNIEREFGFVPMESGRRGRSFNRRFYGFFAAMTGFSYFHASRDVAAVDRSAVPRLLLTAVGEQMTDPDDRTSVLGYTEFDRKYRSDAVFQHWFAELNEHLAATTTANPHWWDRLIAAQANLLGLCTFLDPHGRMVRLRPMANLRLITSPDIRKRLVSQFPKLVPPPEPSEPSGAGAIVS